MPGQDIWPRDSRTIDIDAAAYRFNLERHIGVKTHRKRKSNLRLYPPETLIRHYRGLAWDARSRLNHPRPPLPYLVFS